jgi:hypothetical protein
VPEIPYSINNLVRLTELVKEEHLNHEFNVVGILFEIGEERIIEKENGDLFLRRLKVGDPISNTLMEVAIWNR